MRKIQSCCKIFPFLRGHSTEGRALPLEYRTSTACPQTAEMRSPRTPFWGHRDIPSNYMYLVCILFWRKNNRKAQSALLKQQVN